MREDMLVDVEELTSLPPPLENALTYWDSLRAGRPFPARHEIDPSVIARLLPQTELIDVIENTDDGIPDFRYRLIGGSIDGISQHRYSKKRVSEIESQRPPSQIHSMLCLTLIRRSPVAVRLPYIGGNPYIAAVDNLVVPMSSDGETIDVLMSVISPLETPNRHPPRSVWPSL